MIGNEAVEALIDVVEHIEESIHVYAHADIRDDIHEHTNTMIVSALRLVSLWVGMKAASALEDQNREENGANGAHSDH